VLKPRQPTLWIAAAVILTAILLGGIFSYRSTSPQQWLVERWQGLSDPGLLGPDPREELRRRQLAAVSVVEALAAEAPLVLPREVPAIAALEQLVAAQGHCLLVSEGDLVLGLVTLPDLQRALATASANSQGNGTLLTPVTLGDCQRSELVWLPLEASLAQLEDQLRPSGLRQLPVFALEGGGGQALPVGLPRRGLPLGQLRGLASRDGLARALASQLIPSLALSRGVQQG
jgi:hypothetical protein